MLIDRHDRPDHHPRYSKGKQEIRYLVVKHEIKAKHAVKNLEEQKNIPLGDKA